MNMQKHITFFGEDQDEKGIYNLIVRAVDIPPDQFEQVESYLKNNGFDIVPFPPDTIKAIFKHENMMVVDTYRQLDRDGWVVRTLNNIKINDIDLDHYIGRKSG
jgi:hypothetical protein